MKIAETGYAFVREKGYDAIKIYVDAKPTSDLLWESLETEIEMALKLGAKLAFEIDLGLSERGARFRDPAHFFSRGIGISEFEDRITRVYKKDIGAIILYRGKGKFSLDAPLHADFLDSKREFFGDEKSSDHMMHLFSTELLMQYLHRTAAPLIDEIPLFAIFDFSEVVRPSYQAELLSQSFFPYIIPRVLGVKIPLNNSSATLGVVLPEVGKVPYDLFDEMVKELEGISYRIFPESLIPNSWHGLDQILVFSKSLTEEGRRMLKGFEAAEGKVIGVEGFEPPAFWSQTRRASQAALYSDNE